MTEKRLVALGSVMGSLVLFIRVAVAFFLMPFVIGMLGTKFYGVWVLIGTFIGYYGIFDFGIGGAAMKFVSREIGAGRRDMVKYYVNSAFFFLSILGFLIIIISFASAFIAQVAISDPETLKLFKFAIIVIGISVGTAFPLRVFDGFLGAHVRFDIKRYIEFAEIAFRTTLTVVLLKKGFGIYGLASASAISTFFELLVKTVTSIKIDSTLKFGFEFISMNKLKEMFDFSSSNFLNTLNLIVTNQLDPYVVVWVSNVTTVAYYGVALTLVNYFSEFFRTTQGVLFPLFSQRSGSGDIQGAKQWMFVGSRLSTIVAALCGSLVILYGRPFIGHWLGPSYHSSYIYTVLLIAPLIFAYSLFPSGLVLFATGKHWQITVLDLLRSGSNLIMSLILGYKVGAMGVAIGTAIPCIIFDVLIKPYYSCSVIDVNPLKYFGSIFVNIFKILILVIPIWYIGGRFINENYTSIGLMFCIHFLVVGVLGYFILINESERRWIQLYVKSKFSEDIL